MKCTTSGCSAVDALAGDTVTYTHNFDQKVSVSIRTYMLDVFKYFFTQTRRRVIRFCFNFAVSEPRLHSNYM